MSYYYFCAVNNNSIKLPEYFTQLNDSIVIKKRKDFPFLITMTEATTLLKTNAKENDALENTIGRFLMSTLPENVPH